MDESDNDSVITQHFDSSSSIEIMTMREAFMYVLEDTKEYTPLDVVNLIRIINHMDPIGMTSNGGKIAQAWNEAIGVDRKSRYNKKA